MADKGLFIGKVAEKTGLSPKTIRYYEAIGLLPKPERSEHRYRLYSPEAIELLKFIKKAQGLGLKLSEIREIIAIRQQGELPCLHVRAMFQEKLKDLDRKITELQTLRDELHRLLANWTRRARAAGSAKAAICPHIEAAGRPRLHQKEKKLREWLEVLLVAEEPSIPP